MSQRYKVAAPPMVQRAQVSAIVLDPEFRELVPQPAADESRELLNGILLDGCSEPLIVWRWRDRLILVVGYHLFPALRQHHMSFPIIEKFFASRAEARQFIIKYHLRHGLLSRLALSYFRGQRCLAAERLSRGGDRRSETFRTIYGPCKSMAALAEIYHVSRQTLWNDMELAEGVDILAANGGPKIKPLILARESRFTHARVLALTQMEPKEQQRILAEFLITRKLPRALQTAEKASITVPRKLPAMVEKLFRRLSLEETVQAYELWGKLLAKRDDVHNQE